MSVLECQKRFVKVWNRCKLGNISAAIFGLPPDDGNYGVPNSFFTAAQTEQINHSLGSIWTVRITGQMRLLQGSRLRARVEALLITMNKVARGYASVVSFMSVAPSQPVQADVKRLAGNGVEVIPIAFEIKIDVSRV